MRASGILLPVASLSSKYGIGCFSKEAYDFIDVLRDSGQSLWQILPLGPTGHGDSPYQSFSTFAGNSYFIDLDELVKEGILTEEECNILATYMVEEWIGQQLASVENTRMKYSGSDFKFTSQANHMAKLQSLKKEYERKGFHLQRLYKRRKTDEEGNISSKT